jgi:hypothetical protein
MRNLAQSRLACERQSTINGTMIDPPPTPNSPDNAAAAMAMATRRTSLDDTAGHTTARCPLLLQRPWPRRFGR